MRTHQCPSRLLLELLGDQVFGARDGGAKEAPEAKRQGQAPPRAPGKQPDACTEPGRSQDRLINAGVSITCAAREDFALSLLRSLKSREAYFPLYVASFPYYLSRQ